jgi:glycosyltransferase involved in cell wall biosynthesis
MLVSVITTTYNRPQFIPRLIEAYKRQTYTSGLMEWVILDDGTEKVGHIFREQAAGLNIRYFPLAEKLPMGSKLNILNEKATGDIIIVMDDDDYYPPTRVSSVVEAFQKNPKKQVAGSSKVYMYATDTETIYCAGPYHDMHALNCTLAYRFTYLKTHAYDNDEPCAVERVFLNDFTEPMIQLEGQILHIIHSSNTFKNKMGVSLMKKTNLSLQDFITDPDMKVYY